MMGLEKAIELIKEQFTPEKIANDIRDNLAVIIHDPEHDNMRFVDDLADLEKDLTHEVVNIDKHTDWETVTINFEKSPKKIRLIKFVMECNEFFDHCFNVDLQFSEYKDFDLFFRVRYQAYDGKTHLVDYSLIFDRYRVEK